ncbi:hypothetical protein GF337_14700 [candidate division KSB1 bacterium]|nr:hypothetical protein [candidate division KSB1 bacterium]
MLKKAVFTVVIVLLTVFATTAEVPKLMNYQGMLTDAEGNPIDGTRSIQFSFYLTETGGEAFWTETQDVRIKDGFFSVLLGSATPLETAEYDSGTVFLEVKVADDPPMTPRKQIVSVGYAFLSDDSDHLGGYPAAAYIRKINDVPPDNSEISLVAGDNVTITPNPEGHQIEISATGGDGGGGDNLGNHRATRNIRLNGHWLSNDGGDEGVAIDNNGLVNIPKGLLSHGDIVTSQDMQTRKITVVSDVQVNGGINVGSPSASADNGDLAVSDDVLVDDHVLSERITAYSGWIKTGSPSMSYSNGDIVATDDLLADDDIEAGDRVISGGNMSCGDNMTVENHLGVNMGGGYSTSYPLRVNGDTQVTGNINVGDKLYTSGHVGVNFGGWSNTYAFRVSGNAYATGSWLSSDLNLKRNIASINTPMAKVMQLRGVSYNWKTEEYPEREFTEGLQYGLIAQEVEKVFPDMVMTDEYGEKAIAYNQLIPVLLEALKQQQKQIDELERKVDRLGN